MKTLYVATVVMALLAACGGGGDSSPAAVPPVSTVPPPPVGTPAPGPGEQLAVAPAAPASALKLTAKTFNQGGSAQDTVVNFGGAADLTLSGRLDGIWLNAALPGGSVVVSGELNTIVFMPGVDAKVTVTGSSNTFYLPLGSTIRIEGSGAASSTIRYYKP